MAKSERERESGMAERDTMILIIIIIPYST